MGLYILEKFGSTMLPRWNSSHDTGVGPVSLPSFELSGGGSYVPPGRKPLKAKTIPMRGLMLNMASAANLRTSLMALRSRIGEQDRLWRLWDSGEREWTWAWLIEEPSTRTERDIRKIDLGLSFFLEHPVWYAETPTVLTLSDLYDSGGGDLLLMGVMGPTSGPVSMTWVNAGNYPLSDLVFTLTSGTGTVTGLLINNTTTLQQFIWSSSLPTGGQVVIDTGGATVYRPVALTLDAAFGATTLTVASTTYLIAGRTLEIPQTDGTTHHTTILALPTGTTLTIPAADALPVGAAAGAVLKMGDYASLTPPRNHTEWMTLEPGVNEVSVTLTDSSSDDVTTLQVEYYSVSA